MSLHVSSVTDRIVLMHHLLWGSVVVFQHSYLFSS